MIRLKDLLENADTDVLELIRTHFDVITGNYEEWLETHLDEMVEAGEIDPWAAYDTKFMLQRNIDEPDDFIAFIKYRHNIDDLAQLRALITKFM